MHLWNLIFQQEGKSEILALEIRQQEFPILKGQRARKLCRIKYLPLSSPDKMLLHFQPPTLFTNDDVSLLKSACRPREKRNVSFLMCHVWVYFCFPINNLTSHVVKTSSGKLKREPEQISCSLRQPLSDFYNYETKVW